MFLEGQLLKSKIALWPRDLTNVGKTTPVRAGTICIVCSKMYSFSPSHPYSFNVFALNKILVMHFDSPRSAEYFEVLF